MNLGEQNNQYWSKYEAGTTPGLDEVPARSLLEALPNGANVLDVGTGTGRLADTLAKLGLHAYGIDINANEIEANTRRGSAVEYSVQDIAHTTTFPNSFFDLVLFRYTLTNIHKDQWAGLTSEVDRITKPGAYLWLAEPHINDAYARRYSLANESLGDEHAFYVFKDKDLASRVTDAAALQAAIAEDKIARIVRHYDEPEILNLFPHFQQTNVEHVSDTSPSGYLLNTVVMTLQRTT